MSTPIRLLPSDLAPLSRRAAPVRRQPDLPILQTTTPVSYLGARASRLHPLTPLSDRHS
jgi:hypothetical protein